MSSSSTWTWMNSTTLLYTGCAVSVTALVCWQTYRRKKAPKVDKSPERNLKIVITGASRGFGKALAREYVRLGDSVLLAGRNKDTLQDTVQELIPLKYKKEQNILSFVVDVQNYQEMQALTTFAEKNLGSVDTWINNAGVSQSEKQILADTPVETIDQIINTNVLGSLYGTKCAAQLMLAQKGNGHIFNVDGAGSQGMATPRFAAYGFSKAGMPQLLKSLQKETKDTKVGVHLLSPGMVLTDLLLSGNKEKSVLKIFNVLAEHPSTVAKWAVPRMRGIVASDPVTNGVYLRYLTPMSVCWRFLTVFSRKNRLIDENTSEVINSEN
eukprot:gb/GECG01015380.1/.p1 GENE.gb/GECG01015380.1/~~gb/GECG01015380.1/.p1  ORF type:complete len:325 (+),score=37.17 gb/GECG01015380.1/:1-975(+)